MNDSSTASPKLPVSPLLQAVEVSYRPVIERFLLDHAPDGLSMKDLREVRELVQEYFSKAK